jgi:hypothetical protein
VRRPIIAAAVLLALAVPATASALPYLTIGNARYELELRFEHEEESRYPGTDELLNCYRVSSTHVNCYSELHLSAGRCEVWLWRVWEHQSSRERRRHTFLTTTNGQPWGSCPVEE